MLQLRKLSTVTSNYNLFGKDSILQSIKTFHHFHNNIDAPSISHTFDEERKRTSKGYYPWILSFITRRTPKIADFGLPSISPLKTVARRAKVKYSRGFSTPIGSGYSADFPDLSALGQDPRSNNSTDEEKISNDDDDDDSDNDEDQRRKSSSISCYQPNQYYYFNQCGKRTVKLYKQKYSLMNSNSEQIQRTVKILRIIRMNRAIRTRHAMKERRNLGLLHESGLENFFTFTRKFGLKVD